MALKKTKRQEKMKPDILLENGGRAVGAQIGRPGLSTSHSCPGPCPLGPCSGPMEALLLLRSPLLSLGWEVGTHSLCA